MMLRVLLPTWLLLFAAATAHAQTVRVTVPEENFRAAPAGNAIARVFQDVRLGAGERRGAWQGATLEGWIWAPSLRRVRQGEYDVAVARAAGENLRSAPNGHRIALLLSGSLLEEIERRDRWVHVRRSGWIWGRSIALEPAVAARTSDAAARETARAAGASGADTATASGTGADATRSAAAGAALLGQPGGDTVALLRPLVPLEIVTRGDGWTRVRLEGWVSAAGLHAEADSAVLRNVPVAVLQADPTSARGRIVEWSLQFIALHRAEPIRTDFREGEPFLLTRGPGDETGFVYVAVPAGRLEDVQRLTPLRRITVIGRVRTARSALMGAPVIELLELR